MGTLHMQGAHMRETCSRGQKRQHGAATVPNQGSHLIPSLGDSCLFHALCAVSHKLCSMGKPPISSFVYRLQQHSPIRKSLLECW
jgi:hypothetical protein